MVFILPGKRPSRLGCAHVHLSFWSSKQGQHNLKFEHHVGATEHLASIGKMKKLLQLFCRSA